MLRRLHRASTAIVCYEMLHTTATAQNDAVAELALAHLADYAPFVMAIGASSRTPSSRSSAAKALPAAHAAAEQAVKNTREAWAEETKYRASDQLTQVMLASATRRAIREHRELGDLPAISRRAVAGGEPGA